MSLGKARKDENMDYDVVNGTRLFFNTKYKGDP